MQRAVTRACHKLLSFTMLRTDLTHVPANFPLSNLELQSLAVLTERHWPGRPDETSDLTDGNSHAPPLSRSRTRESPTRHVTSWRFKISSDSL
jgi:hypothetical protein